MESLKHRAPYDPVKAHEYYIRTRELKGRKKAAPRFTVRKSTGTVELTGKELAEQRAYAAKRVSEIKNRLAELSNELNKLRSEAREKKAESEREAKKAPTAAEKSEAARESKQYRESHRQSLSTKRKGGSSGSTTRSKSTRDPVATLERTIREVKTRLTAAVAIQRALAGATRSN